MKKYLLLIALLFGATLNFAYAEDKNESEEELLRKSLLTSPNFYPTSAGAEDTSFPRPFAEMTQQNTPTAAAPSTGYYWVDSDENLNATMFPNMRPNPRYIDTAFEPQLWRRIVAGPRMIPKDYWFSSTNKEGMAFFRNPADGASDGDFWTVPEDSTDDAIAGPMPLGIKSGFYFNGIRYDSFYVSTNGLIALTNRRYFYDANGNRVIPAGATNCYDPMSMDWFVGGIRARGGGTPADPTGMADNVPDNFGYLFSVLGADPANITGFQRSVKTNGIRQRGGAINSLNANSKAAIITPFWGDLCLSQWDANNKIKDDHGKVFYKRTFTGDSLIIGFYNAQPKGAVVYVSYGSTQTVPADMRTGPNYITADAQVVLSRLDSSVTIHFNRTSDRYTGWGWMPEATATNVFKYNTTCGVRGFARHVNYGKGGLAVGQPWAGEYEQFTTYFDRMWDVNPQLPRTNLSVKFKQWQNTLRVADIQYRVRSQNPNALNPLGFDSVLTSTVVPDYELLAGHQSLGAIQPTALIQNLTNEIQGPDGVNFVKQQVNFRARFRIRNLITDRIIYNRIVPVDQLCLGLENSESNLCNNDPSVKVRLAKTVTKSAGNYSVAAADTFVGAKFKALLDYNGLPYNGIPPYYFALIHFPPFEPNEFIQNHIGRLRSYIIADPTKPSSGESFGDKWPFDDTMSVKLFVMKRFSTEDPDPLYQRFEEDGTFYHIDKESQEIIPSAYKWVTLNAEMVSGEAVSYHPLPPRGKFIANNDPLLSLTSPVIKMNRVWGAGSQEPKAYKADYVDSRGYGGDEIRSFPIDLRGKFKTSLSISIQRVQKQDDFPLGFGDGLMVGPEPRSIMWDDAFSVWLGSNAASNVADEIAVQFAKPSDNGVADICNINNKNYQHHPQIRKNKSAGTTITNMNAITVYGAGGYLIGFLEETPDSALALPSKPAINSLRPKPLAKLKYDDGFDLEFKKFYVAIPDTFITWKSEGAKNFRFRVKVLAKNDQKNPIIPTIPDDFDDFFVDNIKISFPSEITDIEVASVRIIWPYTMVPASQATTIPVSVKVSNNTSIAAPTFTVKVKIYRSNEKGELSDWTVIDGNNVAEPIYCRTEAVSNLGSGGELEVIMPTWNARKSQTADSANYRIYAIINTPGGDLEPKNDTTYTDVFLRFGQVFAYDPTANVINGVSGADPNNPIGGKGLNLFGSNNEGIGPAGLTAPSLIPPPGATTYNLITDGTGAIGGNGSGSIAMKFELRNTDTLRGFQAYFGQMNMSADQITFRLFEGSDLTPSQNIKGSWITRRGGGNLQVYGRYVTYTLSQPLVLPRGIYWLSISQDGQTGLELGASASKGGMRVMNVHIAASGVFGAAATALSIDKNFRKVVGGNLLNDNFFAFENLEGSGGWNQFTPSSGPISYGHLNSTGTAPAPDGLTNTLTRGHWTPMIRPYFGPKSYGDAFDEFQFCKDDQIVPVELVSFNGKVRASGIDLFWETASEINNSGFMVERRLYSDENQWESIGFVNGNGNTSISHNYNFFDNKVSMKSTYEYRLRQIDIDGTQNCNASNIVTLTFDRIGQLSIEQNMPNPFTNGTTVSFNLPYAQNVKLEVIDMYGNVVRNIVEGDLSATSHIYTFDGIDANGNLLPAGTYFFRLTAGSEILSRKMSIIR